jgi:hypothetical protein
MHVPVLRGCVAKATSESRHGKQTRSTTKDPSSIAELDVTVGQHSFRSRPGPLIFRISPPSPRTATMSVRVVARIRPILKNELDKDTIVTAETIDGESTAKIVRLPSPKNDAESFSFQFSSVYEQDATQQQLFDAESMSRLNDQRD